MSTCGIFGLLALGYYIYAIVNYTFCKKPFCIAVTIMIVFYLFQGLFDTLFFNKFFMPIFCIFLVVGNIHKYEKIE